MTKGEQRVRTTFNPNNNSVVDQIKQKTAELINLIDLINTHDTEVHRLKDLAQATYEEAAMWAVKAATG
jgi:phosphoribosylformimino-5-aminoimidazole carboxamide ribonucleotide (ProFAR) isomerase